MNWYAVTVIAFVAVGGAIGAVLRYAAGHIIDSSQFPWSTFVVNLTGCLLLALIFFAFGDRMSGNAQFFLFTGVFGAFTTMSTFTLETVNLFFDGRMPAALGNILLNGGGCLLGAFAGRYLALLL